MCSCLGGGPRNIWVDFSSASCYTAFALRPRSISMKVSAVIPAYNEAERIGAVLAPLRAAKSVDEIVVVDDGSTDGTAEVVRRFGVKLVRLPENRGKAAALDAGVRVAEGDVLLFLDADLVGLRPEHVEKLLSAYREGDAEIVIGVFKEGRAGTDLSMKIAPFLSGQRVLSRKVWERMRGAVEEMEFGVEAALTKLAFKEGWKHKKVELEGVSHVRKEEKRGLTTGVVDRLSMYWDILRSLLRKI
ncbi:MAG TPA: glycosyltransferase family 2 protein [Candidatus Acetothermia bacterium]|nr:glycosyltransferase family 2 protein [Candidatus Acetothermia bacterium]